MISVWFRRIRVASSSRKWNAAYALLALASLAVMRSVWVQSNDEHTASSPNNARTYKPHDNTSTLVILMGNVRGGESAWQSLYQHVLHPDINGPHVDLALAVGRAANHTASSLYSHATYIWEFDEWDDWTDALDQMMMTHNNNNHNNNNNNHNNNDWHALLQAAPQSGILGACGDLPGSGAVVFWIRWFLSQQLERLQLVQQYDRFVVTRTDHYYVCPLVLRDFALDEVWVPLGQDFQGINDRHVMAPAHKILDVLHILPPILDGTSRIHVTDPIDGHRYPQDYPHPYTAINAETLLFQRWLEVGIQARRFQRSMFTCAVPGDPTRWQQADESNRVAELGVLVKYSHEYDAAQCTCFHKSKYCSRCTTCDG